MTGQALVVMPNAIFRQGELSVKKIFKLIKWTLILFMICTAVITIAISAIALTNWKQKIVWNKNYVKPASVRVL